ncbi:Immunoglobulin-like fold protein [Metarhizium robertsii ARSEF 23]|uniref:Immunoglobulin-like fold protein n=1 Tax=Metarhizium robertsii (strain ARSEF 23 / ATCC MYA-3075) TaxID=655844 RepID=E9F7A3_METRA|nr:Immunoglobulin-like fold protein [Metarhizium robertsii ARSEF 23]EFY96433.1 Immunoglobulin-like fold protein [Metarhizium robertsii ARSEF 23]
MSSLVQITSVNPRIGWPGTIVTITGSNFSSHLDGNTVDVGSVRAVVLKASATKLQVVVGDNAVPGPVVVKRGTAVATFASPFKIAAYLNITNTSNVGPPLTFHGPSRGTPRPGVVNQPVFVVFCHGKGDAPRRSDAISSDMMSELANVNRYWSEVAYAAQRSLNPSGPQGTTWDFVQGPWVELPKATNEYIYQEADIALGIVNLIKKTRRWSVISGSRAVCVHAGGGLTVTDLSSPPAPTATLAANWVGYQVVVGENVAFVAAGADGLISVDISGPLLAELDRVDGIREVISCDLNSNVLIAGCLDENAVMLDISDARSMSVVSNLLATYKPSNPFIKVVGNLLFTASGPDVVLFDLESQDGPSKVSEINADAIVTGIDVVDNTVQLVGTKVVAACGPQGILTVDVADLRNPPDWCARPRHLGVAITSLHRCLVLPRDALGRLEVSGWLLSARPFLTRRVLGAIDNLASSPGLGQEPDYTHLKSQLDVAFDRLGALKDHTGARLFIDVDRNRGSFDVAKYEGLVVCFTGLLDARGGTVRKDSFRSFPEEVDYKSIKGVTWVPAPARWKVVAHGIGHWLELDDMYREVHGDGTVEKGTAEEWDIMGDQTAAPLLSGFNADKLGIYAQSNIATRLWTPDIFNTTDEEIVLVTHGAIENNPSNGFKNLLRVDIANTSVRYYVEVRQSVPTDGTNRLMFDQRLPYSGARVIVTVAENSATRISNSYESKVSLVGMLDVGESAYDAGRLIRITALSSTQANPAAIRVKLQMNLQPPSGPKGQFDLRMEPMNPDGWESSDIWINSPLNDEAGQAIYRFHELGDKTKAVNNGDMPWVHHTNTITARVHNDGIEKAENVIVTAYTNVPPGIGDNGNWVPLQTHPPIPLIAGGTYETVDFEWAPRADEHTCITIAIFPQEGEETFTNNRAQENVFLFDSVGASSHEPVVLTAAVRNPFTVWRCIELRVFGIPDGWHTTVDKHWVWLPPRGEIPLTVVLWTDRDSPRLGNEPKKIDPEAFVRIEGWTYFGEHVYRPIGGIQAIVTANAASHINAAATGHDNRIRTSIQLSPGLGGIPGAVEMISTRLGSKSKLVNFKTGAGGRAEVVKEVGSGEYEVQVFTSSTKEVVGAERSKMTVRVGRH